MTPAALSVWFTLDFLLNTWLAIAIHPYHIQLSCPTSVKVFPASNSLQALNLSSFLSLLSL